MDPTHTRKEEWEGQPFGSVEEVANLLKELIDLVVGAGNAGLSPRVAGITYPDRQYERMPLAELRQLAPALSLHDAMFLLVVEPGGLPKPVAVELIIWNRGAPRVSLEVSGQNEVAVNGVFVAIKERLGALFEKKYRAEELAAEDAKEVTPPPEPTWRKVLNSQWTIQIVSVLIAFGLGLLAGKL
jgi:hypothetical protein